MVENFITAISNKRDEFLKIQEESYNVNSFKYDVIPEEIDILGNEILNKISEYRNDLSIDFIIEQLTKLGQAPNLLYDDDGRFAVTGDGFQSLVASDEADDVKLHFFVEKRHWKSTIREALYYYLDDTE